MVDNSQLPPGANFNPKPEDVEKPAQSPAVQAKPGTYKPGPAPKFSGGGDNTLVIKLGLAAIVVIVLLAIGYHFVSSSRSSVTAVTTATAEQLNLNSCVMINRPGAYYLTQNVSASSAQGTPCIKITASNVSLNGHGHTIIGDGPFTQNATPSYGVYATGSNIEITNMSITLFSYGIFFNQTDYGAIQNVEVKNATISGIYMYKSSGNLVSGVNVTGVESTSGGISINYGENNTVSASSSNYNTYYGLSLSNSTGNKITASTFLGNPVDLVCRANSSFSSSNLFEGSTCYVNSGCNFAYCSISNNESSLTGQTLSKSINSCGSIEHPGSYSLTSNLNVGEYINASVSGSAFLPCILINSSNVNLNCNGYTISHAQDGIAAFAEYNVTLSGCNIRNSTYGVYLNKVDKFGIHKVNATGGRDGLFIGNATGGNMTDVYSAHNRVGIYFNSSTYITLTRFTTVNNTYGVTIDNSTDVFFDSGTSLLNSKVDMYCSTNTYNSSFFSLSDSQCSSTDCAWANQCPIKSLPNLSEFPITSCTNIVASGQYQLQQNIAANGNCFVIKASNVSINCSSHVINSVQGTGIAFSVLNANNIALYNCFANNFQQGVYAKNSNYMTIQNSQFDNVGSGINITTAKSVLVSNNIVTGFSTYGLNLFGVNSSTVKFNAVRQGAGGFGVRINGSFDNNIFNNSANTSDYGFYFDKSFGNNFVNNTAENNDNYDYFCTKGAGAVNAASGLINYGTIEAGCLWIVVIPFIALHQTCQEFNSPNLVLLSEDLAYPYGGTCFNLYQQTNTSASGTTINCAGHTIYALKGGTFLSGVNVSNVKVENCVLINFTNGIIFTTANVPTRGLSIFNNTVYSSATAISVNNVVQSSILNNNISYSGTGLQLRKFNDSKIEYNIVGSGVANAIVLKGSTQTSFMYNIVLNSTNGVSLPNDTFTTLQDNQIMHSAKSFVCSGSQAGSQDFGGNMCSVPNSGCSWLTMSPSC